LHDTPPATAMGVQPVPMGMFRPLSTAVRRPPSAVLVAESRCWEFSTFWQHCWEPVAETAPTRASAVMNVLENMVVVKVVEVVEAEWEFESEERVEETLDFLYASRVLMSTCVHAPPR
jgi:hypothetical protein